MKLEISQSMLFPHGNQNEVLCLIENAIIIEIDVMQKYAMIE